MNRKAARGILVVATACLLAGACSTSGGKRATQGGSYRLGSTGMALSAAAARNPAAVERRQAARQPSAAQRRAETAPRREARTASAPAARSTDPFAAVWSQPRAASRQASPEPRPVLERVAYRPGDLAERTLSGEAILAPALSGVGAPVARAVAPAASRLSPVNRAASNWMLSGPRAWVLAIGLALATLAAFAAALVASRRRRRAAETERAAPRAANDAVAVEPESLEPKRAAGPQYVLPLRPATAQAGDGSAPPRTFSVKAGGVARLR